MVVLDFLGSREGRSGPKQMCHEDIQGDEELSSAFYHTTLESNKSRPQGNTDEEINTFDWNN